MGKSGSGPRLAPDRLDCIKVGKCWWTVLILGLGLHSLSGQWSAYNDHGSGPGTQPNVTTYNVFDAEDGTNGFLKDRLTGAVLPVSLTITRNSTTLVQSDPSGGVPASGTPLHTVFASHVNFAVNDIQNNIAVRTGGIVTYTFSGLDPEATYRFRAGGVRGSIQFTNRWILAEITGAHAAVANHTSGGLTQAQVPEIGPNQVALCFGANHTATTGDLMDWKDIRCGADGTFSIVCRRYTGTVPGGNSGSATVFGYAPTAFLLEELKEGPVAIIEHPAWQSVLEGENATFTVIASGSPLFYQWLREDAPLLDATNASYTALNVAPVDSGSRFSVIVSNQFNSITSNPAQLVVAFRERPALAFNQHWRYNASGQDLGTSWKEPNYDDSMWPSGPGPLGFETTDLPIPLGTVLNSNERPTYYFRTEFLQGVPALSVELFMTNLVDDGAVFYLDGMEFFRLGMPSGPVTFSTTANRSIINAALERTNVFVENLSQGIHCLAVEVHQVTLGSSDLVLGMGFSIKPVAPDRLEFLQTPSSQTLMLGEGPAVFSARVISGSPYQAQWFKDGTPLEGETNTTLTLNPVAFHHRGNYWLQVSNGFDLVQTPAATMFVLPPLDGQTTLVPLSAAWRYHAEGQNLGTAWRQPGFDDSAWLEGPGALATAGELPLEQTGTILPLNTPELEPILTYYFRTTFLNPSANAGLFELVFSNLVDDGAVFYLNGTELRRVFMHSGQVTYNTLATVNADFGQSYQSVFLAGVPLLAGINSLAVEVHQGTSVSSDIVFGTILRTYPTTEEPVRFTQQPQNQIVPLGYPALLSAEIYGSYPIDFQWYKEGVAVPDATNRYLSLPLATVEHAGSYVLHATNASGYDVSQPALLELSTDNYPWVSLLRGPYLQLGTTSSMTVRWRTDALCPSEVRYGKNPGDLDLSVVLPLVSTDHEIRLEGLEPGTRYYYQIGSTHSNLAGGAGFTFTTAPDQPKALRVWAQGDAGTANANALAVANAYLQFTGTQDTDVWLMLGDNAYQVGSDANYQAALFDMFPEHLRRTPLWPTPGNHDILSTEPNGRHAYVNIFTLPTQGEAGGVPSGTEYYYSFNHGHVHFVSLDSETSDIYPDAPMLAWLREDLQANTSDWLIAYWHSPPYTHGSHNSDDFADSNGRLVLMRQHVLPILEAHGVDLVLSGHSHHYERSFLLNGHYGYSLTLTPEMILDAGTGRPWETGAYRKGAPGPSAHQGAVYVVAGCAGQVGVGTLDHPAMMISLAQLGSVVLDIDGNRLDATFLDDTGHAADSFTILKDVPPAPFEFVSTRRLQDGRLVLGWKSLPHESYQLDASLSLESPQWTPISDWILATGATTFWTNQLTEPLPAQFYRARLKIP